MVTQKSLDMLRALNAIVGMNPTLEFYENMDDSEVYILTVSHVGDFSKEEFDRLRNTLGMYGFIFHRIISFCPEGSGDYDVAELNLEFTIELKEKEVDIIKKF